MAGTATDTKPLKAPPAPPPTPDEEYLLSHGWKRDGREWADPRGSNDNPVRKKTGTVPKRGGGTEDVYQFIYGPAAMSYPLVVAVAMQRERDEGKA